MIKLRELALTAALVTSESVAYAQAARRAEPCYLSVIEFEPVDLPFKAEFHRFSSHLVPGSTGSSQLVLVNPGPEPLYLITEAPPMNETERIGSGVPARYYPFFKLVDGGVFEWRQVPGRIVGTDPRFGHPVYGWAWQPMDGGHHLHRKIDQQAGLLLIADAFDYLKSERGDGQHDHCLAEPKPQTVTLSTFMAGNPLTIRGTMTFARVKGR